MVALPDAFFGGASGHDRPGVTDLSGHLIAWPEDKALTTSSELSAPGG